MSLFDTAPQALSMWAMFFGGIVAFVSPCVLPMLPVYAMYLVGGDKENRGRLAVLRRCLGLLFGFVLLFTLMGAGAGALGSLLKNTDRGTLDLITGAFMLVFGLWMLDVFHLNASMPGWMGRFQPTMSGFWGSFAFGLLIAVSWTPCLTPVLANALMLAASANNATMWTGIVSLAVFAMGLCLPMLAVMLLYQWLKGVLGWLRNNQRIIRRIAGAAMILYGLYLILRTIL
ncbi:MAG: cytochrome c biogenesis protein CcdA [Clostridia bacterium]|nr:cytochrome c biogenesis protein CcdA [Clostridia bacterium]MBR3874729.1 cytochrome c biogenesis protein CcdA [Clostridia bacterium]